jgi:hypothetical protein
MREGECLVWRRDADLRHEESCTHGLAILILSNLRCALARGIQEQMAERCVACAGGGAGEEKGRRQECQSGPPGPRSRLSDATHQPSSSTLYPIPFSPHHFLPSKPTPLVRSGSSCLRVLFDAALQDYEKQTGIAAKHPLSKKFQN